MKIMMMTNTYIPIVGGLEQSIRSFTREFRRKGHRVIIVSPRIKGMPEKERDVIRIPAIQRFRGTDFSVTLPIPGILSRFMAEFNPAIVHSHHPFLIGDIALRLCGQYSVPLVYTCHTMFEYYTYLVPIHQDIAKNFMVELSTGYANLADQVIVPTESVRGILRNRGVVSPIEIIPSGIDIQNFIRGNRLRLRKRFNIPADAFLIGYVGRLSPEKNIEFLCRAAARFLREEEDAHFLIVGKGSSEKVIKEIINEEGINSRVHCAGVLEGKDLINSYHAMDAFVFASLSETQGLVILEAMAAHTPAIAVDAPGVRDVISDCKNGRLVSKADQEEFLSALKWYKELSLDQRMKLKEEAGRTAESYSMERCARKMLAVYENLRHIKSESSAKNRGWTIIRNRLKSEFHLFKNFVEASESAVKEMLVKKNRHE